MSTVRRMRWALAAALLLGVAGVRAARAADGEATFGTEWWTQTVPEAKFREFRDLPNGLVLDSFLLEDELGKGRYTAFGTDAFQNDQSTVVQYMRPKWTARVQYTRMPHNFSYVARTPYAENVRGVLTLPDTLQRTNQENPSGAFNSTMTDLLNNARHLPLGFRTDVSKARLKGRPGHGIQFDLLGSKRQRDGNKAYGGSFGFNTAVEIWEPIHQTMESGEARASVVRKKLAVELSGGMDAFENQTGVLIWDNPRRYTDSPTLGSSRGEIDLYPDNRTLKSSAKVGLQLPRQTELTAFVGLNQIRQNDKWVRMTINTAILNPDSFALDNNTDGKALVFTQDYRLTGSPVDKVSGTLRFRRYQYDNRTPVHILPGQVAYDQTWQPGAVETEPSSYTTTTAGADVDVHAMRRVSLFGTAEHNRTERDFREVTQNNEWVFQGGARIRPKEGVQIEGRYRHADRTIDSFDLSAYDNAEQPTLRRYDVAPRQEQDARASVGWTPFERLELSATYEYLRDTYHDKNLAPLDAPYDPDTSLNQLGLLDQVRRTASADGSFRLNDRWTLSGGYGWVQMYSLQRSRESAATLAPSDSTTWQARIKEWFGYADASLEWKPVTDKLSVVWSYEYNHAPGVFHLTNFRNTAVDLPTVEYTTQDAGATVWFTANETTSFGVRYQWEQFDAVDYAQQNVPLLFPVTGAAQAIFLGDSVQDYRAHIVGIFARKTF